MSQFAIKLAENGSKGRYVVQIAGHEDAELTFSRASDRLVIADHTFVPDSMRGMGVAKALAERLISDAREKGFKIVPLCPYVKSQFDRHPDWADLKA